MTGAVLTEVAPHAPPAPPTESGAAEATPTDWPAPVTGSRHLVDLVRRRAERLAGRHATLGLAVAVALTAMVARAAQLSRSYDVFVDEITYMRVGQSVAAHGTPSLYGRPFYLHPPGFFFLEALWLHTVGVGHRGDVIGQVFAMRRLNVVLAGVIAAVVFRLGCRLGSRTAGAVAALLVAVDPLALRVDSLVLIEPAAMLWVLLGYLVLFGPVGRDRALSTRRALAVGVLFGMASLTKDVTVFLTVLPIGVCAATGWVMARRRSGAVLAGLAAPYVVFALVVACTGRLGSLLHQKDRGVLRLLGLIQVSGFNAKGAPSFTGTVLANVTRYGVTYVVMGAGAVAAIALIRDRRPAPRLLGLITVSAAVLLAYAVVLGTLEEQMFYFLLAPAALSIAVTVTRLRGAPRRAPAVVAVVLVATVLLAATAEWAHVRTTADDGYRRLVADMTQTVPTGTPVSVTTQTSEFVLPRWRVGKWVTPDAMEAHDARYVVTASKQTAGGYAYASPAFVGWVRANADPVFRFHGRSNGDLVLWKMRPTSEWTTSVQEPA